MTKEINVTVDPRPLDASGNPQDFTHNPPPYSTIGAQPYPHPQQGYPQPSSNPYPNMGWNPPPTQQPMPQAGQVIITSPIVVQPVRVMPTGASPFVTVCPNCQQQITTRTDSETSIAQHLWAMGLCIIGCWPCCLIPYCMKDCQNTTHYCSNCGQFIGRHGTC
ncbi:lipopolysaccharide-induced tumor necrosis factor-alpha factor homolog [Culicoides brevitarsis]|uniref:lipopolysaccharide-induced tumor necrosis factor-alpha factor homolog n=1 Tax=Culicoides brevitarsis TaxID=469753 RepID=UPI00307B10A9